MENSYGKYSKKPVVIEAIRYEGNGNFYGDGSLPDWLWEAFESEVVKHTNGQDPVYINTLEGPMLVAPGWWIIQGIQGELYPCKPDIFEQSYERVEGS